MEKYHSIQALRAIAAWAVVMGHMGTQAPAVLGYADSFAVDLYKASVSFVHSGVDLFFVISGFIIFTVTQSQRQPDRFRECGDFVLKRILRIYPLFWLTFFFTILPQKAVRWEDWSSWIWQIWLIDVPPYHAVAWTLVLELRFYALVALLLLIFRDRINQGYVALSVGIAAACGLTSFGALPESFFTKNLMLEFVMGVGVAALTLNRVVHFARASLVAGCVGLLCSIAFLYSSATAEFIGSSFAGMRFSLSIEQFRIIGFGVPAALIVYGMSAIETMGSIKIPQWLSRAGDASYSVYLWHSVILTVLAVQFRSSGLVGLIGFYAASVGLVALVSWFSYQWVERSSIRLAHRITNRNSVTPERMSLARSS